MRFRGRILPWVLGTLALSLNPACVRADPGDVESSHDYPGFPRLPGFVITDYDEDNPAEFAFPVARPLPIDADHVVIVPVRGHRYVIRYELGPAGRAPSLFQTQRSYERLAAAAGFTVEKSGAVGDVTETFHRTTATRQIWVYLEPAITVNVLTIVESARDMSLSAPRLATAPDNPALNPGTADPAASAPDPNDDSLYASLSAQGRVIVPFLFQPGKDELDAASQSLVDRVVAMLQRHPDLFLRIEGHTDNTGEAEANLRLSAQRALAVQTRLVAAGIDKKRLDAVGVGGLQPLADNNTAEGREKNRRIELVMWKKYPAFHSPAPNGRNYYPETGSSSPTAKAGV